MIIFKAKYEKAWEISEMQIVCTNKMEDYDYEIVGNCEDNLELLKICLRTIFVNPDKRYKLKFGEVEVIPKKYEEETCGVIDINKLEIIKPCEYKEKKIVAFTLHNMGNIQGLLRNLELYKKTYPDIKCYVYLSNEIREGVIKKIIKKGGKVVKCINIPEWYNKLLNILPFENKNNLFLSRNVESRLTKREIQAIEKFINQKFNLNIIRDNPIQDKLIPNGMWGSKNINDSKIRLKIMEWCFYYINDWEKTEKEFKEQQIKRKEAEKKSGNTVTEIEFVRERDICLLEDYIFKEIYKKNNKDIYAITVLEDYESIHNKEHLHEKRENNEYIGEIFDERNEILNPELRNRINTINNISGWKSIGEEFTINL